jgi:hypothetical protein
MVRQPHRRIRYGALASPQPLCWLKPLRCSQTAMHALSSGIAPITMQNCKSRRVSHGLGLIGSFPHRGLLALRLQSATINRMRQNIGIVTPKRRWWPYMAAVIAAIGFVCGNDGLQLFVFFFIAPILAVCLAVLLLCACFRRGRNDWLWAAGAIATFLGLTAALGYQRTDPQCIRSTLRWAFNSHDYKGRVMSQPQPPVGELKHVIWDAWGFVPAGNTLMYIVNDPEDSLRVAGTNAQSGRVPGIPCPVDRVHRLEPQRYTILLFTDSNWNDCPSENRGHANPQHY